MMAARLPDFYVNPETQEVATERRCPRSRTVRSRAKLLIVGQFFAILILLATIGLSEYLVQQEISEIKDRYEGEIAAKVSEQAAEIMRNMTKPDIGACRDYRIHMEGWDLLACHRTVYTIN